MPKTPENEAGSRIEPPWSPPIAMSASPRATTTALPEEEPPAEYPILWGLCTAPVALVWLPPERQKYSQCVFPAISPPASRMRITMVASKSGTYPSSVAAPFIMGTPATMTLSLMATRLPLSLPAGAPLIDVFRYQALRGFSSAFGR